MIKVQFRRYQPNWKTPFTYPATAEAMKYALIEFNSLRAWERRILWDDLEIAYACPPE